MATHPKRLVVASAVALVAALTLGQAPAMAAELPAAQRAWIAQTDLCRPLEGDNRAVGHCMASRFWGEPAQHDCLDRLVTRESGWRIDAKNRRSSAYGIPQALPGRKMQAHGLDWRTSALVQTSWLADYVRGRYRTPCGALSQSRRRGWY